MAAEYHLSLKKGRKCYGAGDALAIVARKTVITVVRVGHAAIDDLRATLLCRAMKLDAHVSPATRFEGKN